MDTALYLVKVSSIISPKNSLSRGPFDQRRSARCQGVDSSLTGTDSNSSRLEYMLTVSILRYALQ